MIKVLIVDDSLVVQELLNHIFATDPQIQVVGIANNGLEALEAVKKQRPDVVTMDVHMPGIDGFETTRRLMEIQPTPIVIVSGSSSASEVAFSFEALEAGALAVVPRPPGPGHPGYAAAVRELTQTIKLMSEVKVITRRVRDKKTLSPLVTKPPVQGNIKLAVIGASTGGPPALQQILAALPKNMPFPLLIVQHISKGFTVGFKEWLAASSKFPLKIAEHGEYLRAGMGYIAPEGHHLEVDFGPRAVLTDREPEFGLRPSINYLFLSAARKFGSQAVGVLLTGMGNDGARAMLEMHKRGAVTIAQDKTSSVVFGMASEAIKLNAVSRVMPPLEIAAFLTGLAERNRRSNQ